MTSTEKMTTVTPQEILNHRKWSLAAAEPQCDWGGVTTFAGASYRPIRSSDPPCFCATCRNLYDETGEGDAKLVNKGHAGARKTYASLLLPPSPPSEITRTEENGAWDTIPLTRTNSHHPGLCAKDCQFGCWTPSAPSVKRSGTEWHGGIPLHVTVPTLSATHFDAIPTSLPAPRHRDVMNETPDERLKNDLAMLRSKYQSDLVRVMDSKRVPILIDGAGRDELLARIRADEDAIWKKIDAINLLLSDM
jgi:hypothetical protein